MVYTMRIIAMMVFIGLFAYSLAVLYQQESQPKEPYMIYEPSIITIEELEPRVFDDN